ncbi:bacteriohemerythrin [Desulfogranum mediterraneum]|uniref:bacteriohemerythrin n=1 Tax=Desulfogranum mediterraneum TaxID=160661 RepID=UPI000420FD6B|nr:bacteriohemerythrin [Desulfogranum mediterraneum]
MKLIKWHDSFSVGIDLLDQQHKQLFSLVNKLIIALEHNNSREEFEKILSGVVAHTELHFRTEEKMLAIHPQYQTHHRSHQTFTEKLQKIRFTGDESDSARAGQLLEELKVWLANHVLKTDLGFFTDLGYRQNQDQGELHQRLQLLNQKDKVLVVENDPSQRHLIKRHLEKGGFAVFEATNGIEALRIIEENFDLHLVITDLIMPEMDGFELIREIRQTQLTQIYIIVITVSSDRDSLIQSFEYGANDYLHKPIFHRELNLRLKNGKRLLRLESQDDLIFSMAKLADCRSPETGKHLERVKEFTLLLSLQLIKGNRGVGITESIARDISRMSPLHDIGKVGVADGILNKPGRLTTAEFNLMQAHCKIGGDLISSILRKSSSRRLRLAYEITMYHHERWDGTGYPLGLAGKDIPVAARIMALADVYDALTTKRIYKEAFNREKAREVIVGCSGSHFDPVLVAAFEEVEEEFHMLREQLSD